MTDHDIHMPHPAPDSKAPVLPGVPPLQLPTFWRAMGVLLLLIILTLFAMLLHQFGFDQYLNLLHADLNDNARQAAITAHFTSPFGAALFYSLQFTLIMPVLHYAADFPDQPWQSTLAINRVPLSVAAYWLGIWFVTTTLVVVLLGMVERPAENFMELMTAKPHWLMIVATIIMAPLMEESLFRGYLFQAIRHTPLGAVGAVLISSVLFTGMHAQQYTVYGMAQIFVLALVLGLARARSGSLLVLLLIHVTQNTLANVVPLLNGWLSG